MEVLQDHTATRESEPPKVGSLTAAARFAVLAFALTINGDRYTPSRIAADAPDTAVSECDGCDDPATLAPGTPLIGRRLRVNVDGSRQLIVRVLRHDGAVEIDVDGKTYGIQETLSVAVGKKITAIDMDEGGVKIISKEYGVAIVTRAEIERVLNQLADAHSYEVTANVDALFTPQPGTVVAASLGMKRWYDGHDGGPETFGVTFERVDPPATLASRD
jgi:hypothetical protein